MNFARRHLLATTALAGALLGGAVSARAGGRTPAGAGAPDGVRVTPSASADDTATLQRAIDQASARGLPIELAPGVYRVSGTVQLRASTKLIAHHGLATFDLVGSGGLAAQAAAGITVIGLNVIAATNRQRRGNDALLNFVDCSGIEINRVSITGAPNNAIQLWQCSGRIENCTIEQTGHTAINSGNATGLTLAGNRIDHAGNNGIVVWRDKAGPDHSVVRGNRITHIRTDAGGSGQNGNAINAFRTGNVLISDNSIHDCAYSAVRCNAASNAQILANNCRTIGEVGLYAEFAFEGAVIANNIVDGAATGIEVTNFKEGGRLATVQGNLIRNLHRREHEPVDKRGTGIVVEADTVVTGNTIEGAPTSGMAIGWGTYMRNVSITGNLVREARIGMTVSALAKPGTVLIANNIIAATVEGAVRLTDHDTPIGEALANGNAPARQAAILEGNLMS